MEGYGSHSLRMVIVTPPWCTKESHGTPQTLVPPRPLLPQRMSPEATVNHSAVTQAQKALHLGAVFSINLSVEPWRAVLSSSAGGFWTALATKYTVGSPERLLTYYSQPGAGSTKTNISSRDLLRALPCPKHYTCIMSSCVPKRTVKKHCN